MLSLLLLSYDCTVFTIFLGQTTHHAAKYLANRCLEITLCENTVLFLSVICGIFFFFVDSTKDMGTNDVYLCLLVTKSLKKKMSNRKTHNSGSGTHLRTGKLCRR